MVTAKEFPELMDRRAKQLATFGNQEVPKAVARTLNATMTRARNVTAMSAQKKVNVPANRLRETMPIRRATPGKLYASVAIAHIGIPWIELSRSLRNTKKISRGQISSRKIVRRGKLLGVTSKIKGSQATRLADKAFIARGGRAGKIQIFRRVSKGRAKNHKEPNKYGRMDNPIYVPKVLVYKPMLKNFPRIRDSLNRTYAKIVLYNEYNFRFNKYVD